MLNQKNLILIAICLLSLSHSLFSQIILQGTVMDNGAEYLGNGAEPVVNALVKLTDQEDTNRTFCSYTDKQGQYSIQITQTDVNDDPLVTPGDYRLLQNYPNPFNPSTIIGYELSKPSHISIEIYNVLGQKVRTLLDGFQNSSGQVVWNATTDTEQGVPTGMYIYSMKAEGKRINRKMLLIDGQQGSIQTTATPSSSTGQIGNSFLNKAMSDQFVLEVIGENIAPYEQQDLEITASMTVDVTVTRTVTDIDGNVYQTVKIGDQWWMLENLKVAHYANGDTILHVADNSDWEDLSTGAWCVYDNNESHANTYGYLYNWFAVNDSCHITPQGWHVPTDDEWKELEMYLGMSQSEADTTGWRGTDEGGKLKETGIAHWNSPNTGATNESGFSVLPSGWRTHQGNYDGMGIYAVFWTSTVKNIISIWCRYLGNDRSEVYRESSGMGNGFPIRCVRD